MALGRRVVTCGVGLRDARVRFASAGHVRSAASRRRHDQEDDHDDDDGHARSTRYIGPPVRRVTACPRAPCGAEGPRHREPIAADTGGCPCNGSD